MLDVFRVLPDDSELTRSFRRRPFHDAVLSTGGCSYDRLHRCRGRAFFSRGDGKDGNSTALIAGTGCAPRTT